MKQYQTKVTAVGDPLKGVYRPAGRNIEESFTITFTCPEIARTAAPGQFVMVHCRDAGNTLPRPFSIHRVQGDELSLYIARLENGKGTAWLEERQPGETVELLGPLGNGFTLGETAKSILLVSGGMGIAPMIFLADQALSSGLKVTILFGKAGGERLPVETLIPAAEVIIASEDGSEGHHGLVTDLMPAYAAQADAIYICGPAGMYKAIVSNKEKLLSGKPTQVSLETRMACGRGICYGCTIETASGQKRVCEDGPVFDINELIV